LDTGDDPAQDDAEDAMTPRGTKYWSSGAIPLIAPEILGDIIATASDIAVVISRDGGVLSVLINPSNRTIGRLDHWEGHDLRDLLTTESISKFDAQLGAVDGGFDRMKAVELNHSDGTKWEFPIRYTFHPIGPEGSILMLGRDLRPIAEMQQQLVKAQLALERDYEAQREYDTRYRVLMETMHDAMVFVGLSGGRISDVNAAAADLLGASRDELIGTAFTQEFEGRRRGELIEALTNSAFSEGSAPVELQARRSRRKLKINPTIFRASGERILLCRIEAADMAPQLVGEMSENLSGFFSSGVDGIVFTDRDGVIRAANDSFLNMIDVAHLGAAKGHGLDEFLARGSVDVKVLVETAARVGQMRMFATKLLGQYGVQVPVEISATYLSHRSHPSIVFVIRDVSRAEALRKPGAPVSDEAVRNLTEMVGSATLKDIVAETTDVVEKMCIETAVDLTRNNRVAAAEMLGLSRQSLYVKLRKYGLLSRDSE
jgi:transcriptional regulator PpsR